MAGITDAPWHPDISIELKNNKSFRLKTVAKYFKLPVTAVGKTGICCNCERAMSIQCSGLCNTCYQETKGKEGVDLLNALTAVRARLCPDANIIDRGKIGGEKVPFEKPKVIKTIPVTDPKYAHPPPQEKNSADDKEETAETYETNVSDGKEAPECITPTNVSCDNVFLVDDVTDPDEMNVVGPLDNPNIAKNSALRAEAVDQMEDFKEDTVEVVSESHSVVTVQPVIKRSVVVEFGDAEIEFRGGTDTVDIRVEDGGDLVFFARDVDKSFLEAISSLR